MTIKHKGNDYKILNIETVASNRAEGRENLARHMEKQNMIAVLWISKPKGRKIGFLRIHGRNETSNIVWTKI
jgi:hypothetical protein